MKIIVTVPPYAKYVEEALEQTIVSGLRLNTVLPVKDPLENIVHGLRKRCGSKNLWIDLKSRQLRVKSAAYAPYAYVELSHPIEVELPVEVLLNGGAIKATCIAIDGAKLILEDLPPVPFGAGMSLNILHPTLTVKGFLTERDRNYITAAREVDHHLYMLSFVENTKDIEQLFELDPEAQILAKIESEKGVAWVKDEYSISNEDWKKQVHLVAARGDLYLELDEPATLPQKLEDTIKADPKAVAASRIFESFCEKENTSPTCQEIMDITLLRKMGYESFLLGDELGFSKSSLLKALEALSKVTTSD